MTHGASCPFLEFSFSRPNVFVFISFVSGGSFWGGGAFRVKRLTLYNTIPAVVTIQGEKTVFVKYTRKNGPTYRCSTTVEHRRV